MIKVCSRCGEDTRHSKGQSWCILCIREYNKTRNKVKRSEISEKQSKHRKTVEGSRRRRAFDRHYCSLRRGAVPCTCCTLEDILKFYMNRVGDMTVDHIVPCAKGGAHCLKNFQYLTHAENAAKCNSEDVDE